ncbi:hypothetical protein F9L00_24705 [Brucella anthropi]|uniref:DUF1834 family protein n=1 Tax=Brucella anthropi TaxID=529 RepID=A0A6L3Z7Q1_BRUAN|nr:hypothetical protein [Brucella anthropi]KAB2772170.1 hypothetical protein F9L04_07620 [Brucella anthropi]KAB2773668.1 hypothetical protein F9L00_24705 [Brucella anthropi]
MAEPELTKAPIRVMEAAIIARLRLAFPEKKFQIGRVPAVLTVKEFERILRLKPFIGLAWMGLQPDRDNGRLLSGAANWRLVLVVKASSSLDARFKGDKFDIGLDAMIDVSSVLLSGCTLSDIGTCTVTRAEAVYADGWADDATVLAQVDFDVRFTSPLSAFQIKSADDLKSLGITWITNDAEEPVITDTINPEESHA